MIKAVIFDFDGVIVDTERDRFVELNKILKRFDLKLKYSWFKDIMGVKTNIFLKKKFPKLSDVLVEKISSERRNSLENNPYRLKKIPGIIFLVKTLSKHYRLAIVTGTEKPIVKKILKKNNMEAYFDALITGEMFKSSKPDPECYRIALRNLKLKANEVIIIEDSEAGINAGRKLGCTVYALKNEYNAEHLKNANKIFRNHKEIKDYFLKSINLS